MNFRISLLYFFILFLGSYFVNFAQETPVSLVQKTITNIPSNEITNFQITSYNKLIVTANPDYVEGNIDSIFTYKKGKKIFKEIDSSDCEFKKIISKQHLYQTEKISVITRNEKHTKEQILSTKMAGFNEPIFEYFSLDFKPFDIYQKKLVFLENEYINPISNKGIKTYQFTFLEKTTLQGRPIQIIRFTSKNTKEKLEGTLYIDLQKYSIAKATFKTFGKVNINTIHQSEFNEKLNNWFPNRTSLTLKKGNSKYPIKILGETISFTANDSKNNPTDKKYASDFIEVKSDTRYTQFTFGLNSEIKKKHIALEISEKAINRKEDLWYSFFNDSTDVRSNPTYVSLDSLMLRKKIENKIKIGRKVINGYYPIGFFDVDLRSIARYNNYEGFRLGLGGVTNHRFSKLFKTEGYYVYGTKDGVFKGHLSSAFRLNKTNETWLGASYKDDVLESANATFEIEKMGFRIYDPRPFNISTFYNHQTWKIFVESKFIPKAKAIFQLTESYIEPKFNYSFVVNGDTKSDFIATAFTTSIQWSPFSKFMQIPNEIVEIDKNYPKFTFQFFKTIPGVLDNSYNFGKAELKIDYQKKLFNNHKILFLIEGGYAFGDTPLTHLYNHSPNNLTKNKIIQRITFAAKDSFETMYFNEFFSDKYVSIHVKHQFAKWEWSRQVKPVFTLVTRYGIGELKNPTRHIGMSFKTLEKGFYESGFELNQIFKGLGITGFYRYGPNQLPSFEDNIAIKLSIQINLGFNN
jgi:Family of unknown function (DUF5686)